MEKVGNRAAGIDPPSKGDNRIPQCRVGRYSPRLRMLLELYVWKQARRVLRGQWGREAPALPEPTLKPVQRVHFQCNLLSGIFPKLLPRNNLSMLLKHTMYIYQWNLQWC